MEMGWCVRTSTNAWVQALTIAMTTRAVSTRRERLSVSVLPASPAMELIASMSRNAHSTDTTAIAMQPVETHTGRFSAYATRALLEMEQAVLTLTNAWLVHISVTPMLIV